MRKLLATGSLERVDDRVDGRRTTAKVAKAADNFLPRAALSLPDGLRVASRYPTMGPWEKGLQKPEGMSEQLPQTTGLPSGTMSIPSQKPQRS
jgi:hypothetical protein